MSNNCYKDCFYYTDSCFNCNCMKGKDITTCEGYIKDEDTDTCCHKKDGKCMFFSNVENCNYEDLLRLR